MPFTPFFFTLIVSSLIGYGLCAAVLLFLSVPLLDHMRIGSVPDEKSGVAPIEVGSLKHWEGFGGGFRRVSGSPSDDPEAGHGDRQQARKDGGPSTGVGPWNFYWFLIGCGLGLIVLVFTWKPKQ